MTERRGEGRKVTGSDGIIVGSGLNRFTARVNVETQVKDWMKIGGTMTYGNTKEKVVRNQGDEGVIMSSEWIIVESENCVSLGGGG